MMKRFLDVIVAAFGLLAAAPVLLPVMFLVWLQDRQSPFYVAPRVGQGGRPFRMVKLRSMVADADKRGGSSTSSSDRRITPVGHFIRRYKLDELTQLWNVLLGDMSLVGPRPQVQAGVDVYTSAEQQLLSLRPGITDFASVVFSDEGEILRDSADPDRDYDLLIRPWKGRLGLIYVRHSSVVLDLQLVAATAMAIVSRTHALKLINRLLLERDVQEDVVRVAARTEPLRPAEPPDERFLQQLDGRVSAA